jgi:hypothetical protein
MATQPWMLTMLKGLGLSSTTRAGDLRNSFTINYDNNANQTYTATDLTEPSSLWRLC